MVPRRPRIPAHNGFSEKRHSGAGHQTKVVVAPQRIGRELPRHIPVAGQDMQQTRCLLSGLSRDRLKSGSRRTNLANIVRNAASLSNNRHSHKRNSGQCLPAVFAPVTYWKPL